MTSLVEIIAQVLCLGFFLYQWIIIIAVIFTWVSADPYNPIVHGINRLTWPFWNWCGRWLPSSLQPFKPYVAWLLVMFLQVVAPATLLSLNSLFEHQDLLILFRQLSGHVIQGIGLICQSLLMFGIMILVVWFFLSLINPSVHNPIVRVIFMLADPLITPLQTYLPRTKIDLSPIVGIVLFYLMNSLLLMPLSYYGMTLSYPIKPCLL